jgi:hypothetical protein
VSPPPTSPFAFAGSSTDGGIRLVLLFEMQQSER